MRLSDRIAHLVVHRPHVLWIAFGILMAVAASLIFYRAKLNSDVLDMLPSEFESVGIYKVADREFSTARELLFGLQPPEGNENRTEENGWVDLDGFAAFFTESLLQESWVLRAKDKATFGAEEDFEQMRAIAVPLMLDQPEAEFSKTLAALQPEAIRARLNEVIAKFSAGIGRSQFEIEHDPLGIVLPSLKALNIDMQGGDDANFRVVVATANMPNLEEPACNDIMAKVEDFKARVTAEWMKDHGPAPRILCSGRTAYVAEMAGLLKADIKGTLLGSIFLVAVTFYTGFRRWKPLRAIVDALLFSCLLAVACGVALFGSLNMITIGLCSILVGLGVDLAMVLYALYLDERERGHGHEQAIAAAIRTHGPGIWFGALTTAAAFLCLLLSGSPGYEQLGVLIACGILLTALVMMSFLWILFNIPRWVYLAAALAAWLGFDFALGGWQGHWWLDVLATLAAAALAFMPYRAFRWTLLTIGLAALGGVLSTMGSWDKYIWENIWAGVIATVLAVFLVEGLIWLTKGLPQLIFTKPSRLLGVTLPIFLVIAVVALRPIGTVKFDIDPKSLEPKPSKAGDALRTIMAHLNPDHRDFVMAVIKGADAEDLSAKWKKVDAAWRKLTGEKKTASGAEPVLVSMNTPAGLALSPARMKANAARLASLDLEKSKAAFDEALVANGFVPKEKEFAGARSLFDAFGEAARGRLDQFTWKHALPESSAWWFLIENSLSHDSPAGLARIKPTHDIRTPADAEKLRQALAVDGVPIGYAGWGVTLAELEPWSKNKMVGLSALMVALNIVILTIMLKTWRPVAIIMLGLAFSICGLYTTLKIFQIPLNLFNILAFPLVLGVGVDYSIYATLAVRSADPRRELTALMKPLILSGLTTVIGFLTLYWSHNPALKGLGLLCGAGVGWCLATAFLIVLPMCAMLARKKTVVKVEEPIEV